MRNGSCFFLSFTMFVIGRMDAQNIIEIKKTLRQSRSASVLRRGESPAQSPQRQLTGSSRGAGAASPSRLSATLRWFSCFYLLATVFHVGNKNLFQRHVFNRMHARTRVLICVRKMRLERIGN